jgi:type I restriction-modification system DNA methylase subunit
MLEQLENRWCCVVRVLVETIAPDKGRVYDPCCGSAGMFVQSEKFVEEHGGRITPPALGSGRHYEDN